MALRAIPGVRLVYFKSFQNRTLRLAEWRAHEALAVLLVAKGSGLEGI
ncbi:hypothetical protein [Halorussus ruber]|nr:hypothetical protein [Halorussus ruber]